MVVTYELYKRFDCNPLFDLKGTPLNIFKTFDNTVCYTGLICKLQFYGIGGNFLKALKYYSTNRKQRIAFNGQTSQKVC